MKRRKRRTQAIIDYKANGGVKRGGGSFQRSVCIDYLYCNPGGTMTRVIQSTEGVTGAAEK